MRTSTACLKPLPSGLVLRVAVREATIAADNAGECFWGSGALKSTSLLRTAP